MLREFGMMMSRLVLVSSLLSLTWTLTGCTNQENSVNKSKTTLKVMYYWDKESLYRQYGNLFVMEHPDIELEVVSTALLYKNGVTDKIIEDFIAKEKPDVIFLGTEKYGSMAKNGDLVDLTPLAERDNYDLDTIFPGMIRYLKNEGGGKLFGLAPSFQSDAIIYNADLFEKYGVELPHDGMTWKELIELAGRFPTHGEGDARIFGYSQETPLDFEFMRFMIGGTYGLQLLNSDTRELTVNTDAWRNVFQLALDATGSNIYSDTDKSDFISTGGNMYEKKPFIMGKAAMTTSGPYIFSQLKDAQETIKDYKPFKVGVVAGPVDPAEPDKIRGFSMVNVSSIYSKAQNKEAAWEFVKFINGEKYAKIKSRTLNAGLLSRMNVSLQFDGHSLEAFYKLEPKMSNSTIMTNVPGFNYTQYLELQNREIGLVMEKKKSLEEALRTMQEEGQASIDLAKRNEEQK
ncbi:Maltose-binding periplasmic protein precursor [compost metagenome]